MRKRMTISEKKERARIKGELQKKGILPPDKPRLNRKKFAKDTISEWVKDFSGLDADIYLRQAILIFLDEEMQSGENTGKEEVMRITKRISSGGAIQIPVGLRRSMNIHKKDVFDVQGQEDGSILLKPYVKRCIFCDTSEDIWMFEGRAICGSCLKKAYEMLAGSEEQK